MLQDRVKAVELLRAETMGVSLGENDTLVPERSTDTLGVRHPQAKYFDT